MRQRVWISGSLLILVILAILIYEKVIQPQAEKRKEKTAIVFPDFNPEQVVRIELSRKNQKDVLVKKDSKWLVETEANYPADPEALEKIFNDTKELTCAQVISTSKKQWVRFELTPEKALEVKFLDKDSKPLAHFYIGKRGPTYSSSYFRKAEDEKICLAYKNLISSFDKTNDTWRDKAIFRFSPEECQKLELKEGDSVLMLEKDLQKNEWYILEGEEKYPAKNWAVDGICQTLSNLKTQDFPQVALKKTGLSRPDKQAVITLAGGRNLTLLVGRKVPDTSRYYVKRADQETIFSLSEWQINSIFKKKKDLRQEEKKKEEKSEGKE